MKRIFISILLLLPYILFGQQRPKVALVLGGGGAKGAAHVGVLKYIEQSQIPIDMVVGTSIGSIIGGLYSIGYTSAEMDSIMRSQRWITLITDRRPGNENTLIQIDDDDMYVLGFHINLNPGKPRRPSADRIGAFKGDSITALFHELIAAKIGEEKTESCNFDDLPLQFRAMAFGLNDFTEVTLAEGSLPLCMRASMSIPLAFRPVKVNDNLLVDGGVLNNLPVDIARSLGADYVIAVDLTVNHHEDRNNYLEDVLGINGDSIFVAKGRYAGLNLINWGLFRPDLTQYHKNCEDADIYINPDLSGYGPQDFFPRCISDMIHRGEVAGEEALSELIDLRSKVLGQ